MTLKRALGTLPDDRETIRVAREVVAYLERHRGRALDGTAIATATGLPSPKVHDVLFALRLGHVVQCDAGGHGELFRYEPDTALELEVRRFLASSGTIDAGLRRRVDRFRGTFGR